MSKRCVRNVLWALVATLTMFAVQDSFAQSRTASAFDVFVEVTGNVPGFSDSRELADFLAKHMQGTAPSWHFVAASPEKTPPANRVEWNFTLLKRTWGGGTHKGFPLPIFTRSYLNIVAKLYLNNQYQVTILNQPTAVDGPRDAGLAAAVAEVTQDFIAYNRIDKP